VLCFQLKKGMAPTVGPFSATVAVVLALAVPFWNFQADVSQKADVSQRPEEATPTVPIPEVAIPKVAIPEVPVADVKVEEEQPSGFEEMDSWPQIVTTWDATGLLAATLCANALIPIAVATALILCILCIKGCRRKQHIKQPEKPEGFDADEHNGSHSNMATAGKLLLTFKEDVDVEEVMEEVKALPMVTCTELLSIGVASIDVTDMDAGECALKGIAGIASIESDSVVTIASDPGVLTEQPSTISAEDVPSFKKPVSLKIPRHHGDDQGFDGSVWEADSTQNLFTPPKAENLETPVESGDGERKRLSMGSASIISSVGSPAPQSSPSIFAPALTPADMLAPADDKEELHNAGFPQDASSFVAPQENETSDLPDDHDTSDASAEVESPEGVKPQWDKSGMISWGQVVPSVYTAEQQQRLGVDENGNPVAVSEEEEVTHIEQEWTQDDIGEPAGNLGIDGSGVDYSADAISDTEECKAAPSAALNEGSAELPALSHQSPEKSRVNLDPLLAMEGETLDEDILQAPCAVPGHGGVVAEALLLGPAWTRGEIEAPEGEKDMGTWKKKVYTPEQQQRLEVDENGEPVLTPSGDSVSPGYTPERQHRNSRAKRNSNQQQQQQQQLDESEPPAGVKLGQPVYTLEQQQRLGVNEEGFFIDEGGPELSKLEDTVESLGAREAMAAENLDENDLLQVTKQVDSELTIKAQCSPLVQRSPLPISRSRGRPLQRRSSPIRSIS